MSENLSIWIQNTVAGFLYTIAGLFFFLCLYGINDLMFLDNLKDYLAFIIIGVIAFSSIVGFSAQKILEHIIYLIKPKFKYNADEEIKLINYSESLQKRHHNLYAVLVLYRHLILGSIIIWISLLCWLNSSGNVEYWYPVSLISIFLIAIFIITYFLHRKSFIAFKKVIPNDDE